MSRQERQSAMNMLPEAITRPLSESITLLKSPPPPNLPNPSNNEQRAELPKITIPLLRGKNTYAGKNAYVSPIDADIKEIHPWQFNEKSGYAKYQWRESGRRYISYIHREIAERKLGRKLTDKDIVKHINGDKLDNRRENINIITQLEQLQSNIDKNKERSSSKYRGVSYDKMNKKWVSQIRYQGKREYLGRYSTQEEAAQAYNNAAKEYYGEKARLNILPEKSNNTAENLPDSRCEQRNNEQTT